MPPIILLTDMVTRSRLLAAHGLTSCLSVRTQRSRPLVRLHRPLPYRTIHALGRPGCLDLRRKTQVLSAHFGVGTMDAKMDAKMASSTECRWFVFSFANGHMSQPSPNWRKGQRQVHGDKTLVVVVERTRGYHVAMRSQVLEDDNVVEIGSACAFHLVYSILLYPCSAVRAMKKADVPAACAAFAEATAVIRILHQ